MNAYELAKARYAALGVDTEEAICLLYTSTLPTKLEV